MPGGLHRQVLLSLCSAVRVAGSYLQSISQTLCNRVNNPKQLVPFRAMSNGNYGMNTDIRAASTIPSRFYAHDDEFEASKERIFAKSWQFITGEEFVKVPGSVFPFTLLEGALNEPLLFTRDDDDKLHCLSNVCTHRGNLVVEGPGVERSLRCRYHGRRFALDGKFLSMPEFENCEGFPCDSDNLPKVQHDKWGPWLFASLDPVCSLHDYLKPMMDRVGWMPLNHARFAPERARDYLVQAHWALYVDNYLEGFHIPYIHAALSETLDYSGYTTEISRYLNLQLGRAKGAEDSFELPKDSQDFGERIAAYYFWVFPNLMFNFYPWGCSVNLVRPLAKDRTKISFLPFVWDPSRLDTGAGGALDRVEREDEAVVEMVQQGVKSRFYDRGRYSPAREQNVHHFHSLIAEFMER